MFTLISLSSAVVDCTKRAIEASFKLPAHRSPIPDWAVGAGGELIPLGLGLCLVDRSRASERDSRHDSGDIPRLGGHSAGQIF
jgi:hypothetical protein